MGFVEDLAEWLTSCACDQPQSQSSQKAPGGPEANNLLAADSSEPFDDPCCAQSAQKKKSITLPFSKHESSLICLAAALNIAQAFEALPYPPPEASPNGATNINNQLSNFQLSPSSLHSASTPRTLPSFACCAMQAAYALLMVCNQAWAMQTGAMPATQHPRKLLAQCEQGLYSLLGTLDNYALAFEAIRGMRGMSCGPLSFCIVMEKVTDELCVQIKSGSRSMGSRTFSLAIFEMFALVLLSIVVVGCLPSGLC
jgi:hypothetical protein